MLVVIGFMAALLLVWLLCAAVLTVVHELGHALVALIMQPGPVSIFLGSYGRAERGGRLRIARLHVHFRYNPATWARRGLCVVGPAATPVPLAVQLLHTAAGPVLPLLVAALGLLLTFTLAPGAANALKAVPVMFACWAVLSAIINLLPSRWPAGHYQGEAIYNDGHSLRRLLSHRHVNRLAEQVNACLAAERLVDGIRPLTQLLRYVPDANNYRLLVQAYYLQGNYTAALTASRQFRQLGAAFTDDDRFTQALLLSRTDQHRQALVLYSALLAQEPPYLEAYNNRGYTYNLLGEYATAVADFDQAIATETSVAYAHNNRGLAYLRLGHEAQGLADIQHGLQLDPANAYGYRNLGIYHLDRGEHTIALGHFEHAHRLDPTTHDLAGYLQQTRQHLEAASRCWRAT